MSVASPAAEIHVPISATPAFLLRTRLLAASLRRWGGELATSPIVVTVSRDVAPFDLDDACPWARELGVEWRWLDPELWERHGIYGTALQRLRYDFAAPLVVLLDADTLCTGPLDELALVPQDTLAGLIAHIAPDRYALPCADGMHRTSAVAFWGELYLRAGLPAALLEYEHTGWPVMDDDPRRRFCPPYFNLGVLAGRPATMRALGAAILGELEHVDRFLETGFRCQIALTLAVARTGVGTLDLLPRWNFPNDAALWDAHPEEVEDLRVLHYLREGEVRRARDIADVTGLAALVAREDLSPCNAFLRDRLRDLEAAEVVRG